MGTTHKPGRRLTLGVALLVGSLASAARADVTTQGSASVVVFPKVITDPNHDTIIQITNTSNMAVNAFCLYQESFGLCSASAQACVADANCLAGETCTPGWRTIDFTIPLTAQQPTHWVVSHGRPVDPTDTATGFDPQVPALGQAFTGSLLCVQVDDSRAPIAGNALIGEATLEDLTSGDVAKYSALGILGISPNADNVLKLDGVEYNACPQTWRLDHLAYGAEDSLIGTGSAVRTDLTVVPCSQNFETQVPGSVLVQFRLTNEFEQQLSASKSFTCWANTPLTAINPAFSVAALGTNYVQTSMQFPSAVSGGFMVIAQEFRDTPGPGAVSASVAVNVHAEGVGATSDQIVLPLVP